MVSVGAAETSTASAAPSLNRSIKPPFGGNPYCSMCPDFHCKPTLKVWDPVTYDAADDSTNAGWMNVVTPPAGATVNVPLTKSSLGVLAYHSEDPNGFSTVAGVYVPVVDV